MLNNSVINLLFILICFISSDLYGAFKLIPASITESQAILYADVAAHDFPEILTSDNPHKSEPTEWYYYQAGKLSHKLQSNKKYLKQLSNKAEPLSIKVTKLSQGKVESGYINYNSFMKFTEFLQRYFEKIMNSTSNIADVLAITKQDLKSRLNFLSQSNTINLITGIALSLPEDIKENIFKLNTPEKQLEYINDLNIDINIDEFKKHFKAKNFNLDEAKLTKKTIIDLIEKTLTNQDEFVFITVLHRFFHNQTIENESLLNEPYQELLSELSPDIFQILFDKDKIKTINKIFKLFIKNNFTIKYDTIRKPVNHFTIEEVPPHLAALRGYIGNDCSSSQSWAFPYSAFEHVFFIKNSQGKAKGYITMTIVKIYNNEKAIYIKDIVGPTLSADVAEMALHALYKVKKHYGASTMTIATNSFTSSDNQNRSIVTRLKTYNMFKNTEYKPQIYFDSEIRDILGELELSSKKYDAESRHDRGAVFVPQENIQKSLEIKPSPQTKYNNYFPTRLTEEVVRTGIEILTSENKQKEESFLKRLSNNDSIEFLTVKHIFDNEPLFFLDEYYSGINTHLRSYNIKLTKSFINSHPNLFFKGHFRSEDALEYDDDKYAKHTENLILYAMENNKVDNEQIKLIKENINRFLKNKNFLKTIKKMLRSENPKSITTALHLTEIIPSDLREKIKIPKALKNNIISDVIKTMKESQGYDLNYVADDFVSKDFQNRLHKLQYYAPDNLESYYEKIEKYLKLKFLTLADFKDNKTFDEYVKNDHLKCLDAFKTKDKELLKKSHQYALDIISSSRNIKSIMQIIALHSKVLEINPNFKKSVIQFQNNNKEALINKKLKNCNVLSSF